MKSRIAIATYSKDQWKRLLEVAADRDELETTWEEWQAVKNDQVARLRSVGLEVEEVAVDMEALENYCRRRRIANDSTGRAEYAAHRMKQLLDNPSRRKGRRQNGERD